MARKVREYTVTDTGRDKGKTFMLTEMSASAAERWAMRAFFAMAKSGVLVPDEVKSLGIQGLAHMGLQSLSGVSFEDADPLLREMMECVQIIPDSRVPRRLVEDDIEEVKTRLILRREVFALHTDFFTAARTSKSNETPPTEAITTTKISHKRSA